MKYNKSKENAKNKKNWYSGSLLTVTGQWQI